MTEVIVDHEKLAHGLEKGLKSLKTFDPSAFLIYERPLRYLLRQPACGVTSTAIAEHAQNLGLTSRTFITGPSSLDIDPRMEHVTPWIFTDDEHLVIDANYQQFFGYVGLTQRYEETLGKNFFPEDPVISFLASRVGETIDYMTQVSLDFQKVNTHPLDEFDWDITDGPLSSASEAEIRKAFSQIYDLSTYKPWRPADYVARAGREVSRYILSGSIEI